jgi:hypothetical protein
MKHIVMQAGKLTVLQKLTALQKRQTTSDDEHSVRKMLW